MRLDRAGLLSYTAAAVLILGGAVGVVHSPVLLGIGLAGFIGLVWVIARPEMSIIFALAASGLALPIRFVGIDSAVLTIGSLGVLTLGAVASILKNGKHGKGAMMWVPLLTLVLLAVGVAVARPSTPIFQTIMGIRLFVTPIICFYIALTLDVAAMRRVLRFATILIAGSFAAALIQYQLGAAYLVNAGLEYGTTVRHGFGQLRAPGLYETNYALGSFAGVLGALALIWWPTIEQGKRVNMWRWVAVISSVGCLILSIYRTGMLVMGLSVVLWILTDTARRRGLRRFMVVVAGAGIAYYVHDAGYTDPKSLHQRFTVWESVLSRYAPTPWGSGIGYSGSASGSRFSRLDITVDNYFLNLYLQLGVAAIIFFTVLLVFALRMTARSVKDRRYTPGIVLLSVFIGFLFVDFWEYTASMSLAAFACAAAISLGRALPALDPSPVTPPLVSRAGRSTQLRR